MAAISLISNDEVLKAVETGSASSTETSRNFFALFNTTGCLMDCEKEHSIMPDKAYTKGMRRNELRLKAAGLAIPDGRPRKHDHSSLQDWFTADKIAASAKSGCESCATFKYMFEQCYPDGAPGDYMFRVSRSLELRRCPQVRGAFHKRKQVQHGCGSDVESVSLFQVSNSGSQFTNLRASNLLGGRETSLERLLGWFNECKRTHPHCIANDFHAVIGSSIPVRPARLIEVSPMEYEGKLGVRLVETRDDHDYIWACLSHRWNQTTVDRRTTARNVASRFQFLSLDDLTATGRGALDLTRRLGVRWLWVDSLCIIQEGDDDADLNKELSKMGEIYQNAIFTIAAASSVDASIGCFRDDMPQDLCFRISDVNTKENHFIGARILDRKGTLTTKEATFQKFPLWNRAWVFQEQMLSNTFITCGYGEVSYECMFGRRCECAEPQMPPHPRENLGVDTNWLGNMDFEHIKSFQRAATLDPRTGLARAEAVIDEWRYIIRIYVQLELKYASDILPAIGGCAREFGWRVNDTYTAGMWRSVLHKDLLWHIQTVGGRTVPKSRPEQWIAPSWSWACLSIGQIIRFLDGDDKQTSNDGADIAKSREVPLTRFLLEDKINEVYCEPVDRINAYGRVKYGAYLKLDTVLYRWYLRLSCTTSRISKTNQSKRQGRYQFHLKNPKRSKTCSTMPEELEYPGHADIDIRLDSDMQEERDRRIPYHDCATGDDRHPCRLIEVSLLHALHKEHQRSYEDVYILLVKDREHLGKNNYCRIGLMIVKSEQKDGPNWSCFMQEEMDSRHGEFFLF